MHVIFHDTTPQGNAALAVAVMFGLMYREAPLRSAGAREQQQPPQSPRGLGSPASGPPGAFFGAAAQGRRPSAGAGALGGMAMAGGGSGAGGGGGLLHGAGGPGGAGGGGGRGSFEQHEAGGGGGGIAVKIGAIHTLEQR